MNALWRLTWALPLVLAVGAAAMIVLRRFVVPAASEKRGVQRMTICEMLPLSEHTQVHLIEVDGSSYLIVESTQNAALEPLLVTTREPSRRHVPLQPAWLRHLSGASR
jgi:flagellar biogenesis protein FliO